MKRSSLPVLAAIALSLLHCCAGAVGAAGAEGTYELDRPAFQDAMLANMPAEARNQKMAMDMIESMVKGMSAVIDLKVDGTANFDMKTDMMGRVSEQKATGTWKLDGSNLTMVIKHQDGQEEAKTVPYSNGSFSIDADQIGMKMKMTFKRK